MTGRKTVSDVSCSGKTVSQTQGMMVWERGRDDDKSTHALSLRCYLFCTRDKRWNWALSICKIFCLYLLRILFLYQWDYYRYHRSNLNESQMKNDARYLLAYFTFVHWQCEDQLVYRERYTRARVLYTRECRRCLHYSGREPATIRP